MTLSAVPDAPRPRLNDRERQVLAAIDEYRVAHGGRNPSVREIGTAVALSSTSSVANVLERLADKGYLRRPHGLSRGIEVVK